jgi:hypothetical protein
MNIGEHIQTIAVPNFYKYLNKVKERRINKTKSNRRHARSRGITET